MQKKTTFLQALSVFAGIFLTIISFGALFGAPAGAADIQGLLTGEMKTFELSKSNKVLPDVDFLDVANRPARLSMFRGKLVLLTLWATWCPYCAQELPGLNDLQELLGKEKFMVLPISMDKEGTRVVKKYLEEKSLNLPTYADPKTAISQAYETHGIPYSILIDQEGRDIGRIHGLTNWMAPESIELLKSLIK